MHLTPEQQAATACIEAAPKPEEAAHRLAASDVSPTPIPPESVPKPGTPTTDLKGYTAVSEQMDPAALMEWVNAYMSAMAQLVERHGGTVDDYAGDGIKANFGAPLPRRSEEEIAADARNALECALAMGEQMEQLNRCWREQELPTARMRVGIHSGPAVVGSLGSERRLKFTSVGDTVNTAARLESFDKDGFERDAAERIYRILIDDSTLRLVAGLFEVEAVGRHELPGREGKVSIYRVLRQRV
jgi:adenylate cyclase